MICSSSHCLIIAILFRYKVALALDFKLQTFTCDNFCCLFRTFSHIATVSICYRAIGAAVAAANHYNKNG